MELLILQISDYYYGLQQTISSGDSCTKNNRSHLSEKLLSVYVYKKRDSLSQLHAFIHTHAIDLFEFKPSQNQ